jgi:hypothetical protein
MTRVIRIGSLAAALLLAVCAPASAQTHQVLHLATQDLAYSKLTGRLYASVAATNSVLQINPATGAIETSLVVGSQPNRLALSDDGAVLYVGLEGANFVVRVRVATMTVESQFFVGRGQYLSGPLVARDIAVQPGNPDVVAVVRRAPNSSSPEDIAIFDHGVMRPVTTSSGYPYARAGVIEFSASNPSRLYAYDDNSSANTFYRLIVTPAGVATIDETWNLFGHGNRDTLIFAGERMYAMNGKVIDPEARRLLGAFDIIQGEDNFVSPLVLPDVARGVVHFVTHVHEFADSFSLRRYDANTFAQIGPTYSLTGLTQGGFPPWYMSSLVPWGVDGLALRTEQGDLVLIRTGMTAPPPAPAPPTITIMSPTTAATTTAPGAAISLAGTTTGAVASLRWSTDRGATGEASGRATWFASNVPLVSGSNTITVTATSPEGLTAVDTLTVTVAGLSYYLAEGATGSFFDLDLALANPGGSAVPVDVTYLKENGATVVQSLTLGGASRTTIRVDQVAGVEAGAVSSIVTSPSGAPLVVERTMRWSEAGQYGSHTEKATAGPALKWYFAEGSQGFFYTYLLLSNPNGVSNVATVDWLREGAPPVRRTYTLLPNSRATISAGDDPALVGYSFGIVVSFNQPGAAERTMYFGAPPDVLFKAGHNSAGVSAPATTWSLAEGATGPFFETFILLANPNATPVDAVLTFLPNAGSPVSRVVSIPANARLTVNLEALTPQASSLANAAVATEVTASQPIVVERAQYWPYSPAEWYEAHNSAGVTASATRWGLAEGRVGNPVGFPPSQYQTYVLLANPGAVEATATVTFLRASGAPIVKSFTVPPFRRRNVAIAGAGSDVPELADETFGATIVATHPLVVERAMYGNAGGQVFASGSNATATRLP